jgi:hypothetical protein
VGLLWRVSPVSKARKCIGATGILRSSFWLSRTGCVPAKSRQQHIFPDPLAAVVNGITPINSTATGPIHSSAAPESTTTESTTTTIHQLLIVATIKLKQIADSVRNDLAMSVVIENSQLVATESNLAPIGD